jgi:uncharacterized integral membrane protein
VVSNLPGGGVFMKLLKRVLTGILILLIFPSLVLADDNNTSVNESAAEGQFSVTLGMIGDFAILVFITLVISVMSAHTGDKGYNKKKQYSFGNAKRNYRKVKTTYRKGKRTYNSAKSNYQTAKNGYSKIKEILKKKKAV